ncbi:MAG: glycine betaine ABC transporter substrate-binding protein [Actinomycetota bacterium]|nr:glycine betaine ABC transporter substrate-binding protein [Actinomycetota bacterium]
MSHRKTTAARLTALACGLALVLAACSDDAETAVGTGAEKDAGEGSIAGEYDLSGASFDIGSKEFTESIVLGQITAQALEAAGAEATDQTGISGSATVREALVSDEIDMYWEYTGTGWVNILGNTTEDVPEELYSAVAEADGGENDVAWLEPAPMNDTYRIATTQEFAEENGLETMSDVAEYVEANADDAAVCAASEFINRDDGLPGLQEAYGFEFSEVVELDLGLIYTQIGDECPFGEVFSTDGRIVANDLAVIEDDKNFFIEYNAALTMRQETLDEYPQLAELFAPISEALTNEAITELNAAVDVEGETAEDVAAEFLRSNGFIS